MKILVLICVLMLAGSVVHSTGFAAPPVVENGAFEEARAVGTFFLFSTAFGRYVIREDSMGEVTYGAKRRAFWLKRGMSGRIDRIYFREYDGELLVLCEVNDKTGYIVRMNQQERKVRWTTAVNGPCAVEGDLARCGEVNIKLATGARVNPD